MPPFRTFILLLFLGYSYSQTSYVKKGNIELGLRTTTSLFGHDPVLGLGTGGQIRIQLTDFLNTEWYADWITLDLKGAGTRKNAHIGWSFLLYPKKMHRWVPYVIAGHCFDYARVIPASTPNLDRSDEIMERWSSAVQTGLGSHYFLTRHFNLSFSAQFMLHLGKDLEYELVRQPDGSYFLNTNPVTLHGEHFEGHLLLTFGINYIIANFKKS